MSDKPCPAGADLNARHRPAGTVPRPNGTHPSARHPIPRPSSPAPATTKSEPASRESALSPMTGRLACTGQCRARSANRRAPGLLRRRFNPRTQIATATTGHVSRSCLPSTLTAPPACPGPRRAGSGLMQAVRRPRHLGCSTPPSANFQPRSAHPGDPSPGTGRLASPPGSCRARAGIPRAPHRRSRRLGRSAPTAAVAVAKSCDSCNGDPSRMAGPLGRSETVPVALTRDPRARAFGFESRATASTDHLTTPTLKATA